MILHQYFGSIKKSFKSLLRNLGYIGLVYGIITLLSCRQESSNMDEPELSSSKDEIRTRHLHSVKEVNQMLEKSSSIVIIEVNKRKEFRRGHLKGAINIWRPDYETKLSSKFGGMRATKEEMEQLLGSIGILPSDTLLIYDSKGNVDALRLLWILELYGHDHLMIMNGGKALWEQSSYPLSTDENERKATNYQFQEAENNNLVATLKDVKNAINDKRVQVVDTREPVEYLGKPFIVNGEVFKWKNGAFDYGTIPTALHFNWSEATDLNNDHRFKSMKDIKYNFEKAGIDPKGEIIVFCQSGARSSHTAYVLREIFGNDKVRNYDGSWIEWSYEHLQNNVEVNQLTDKEQFFEIYEELSKNIDKN